VIKLHRQKKERNVRETAEREEKRGAAQEIRPVPFSCLPLLLFAAFDGEEAGGGDGARPKIEK